MEFAFYFASGIAVVSTLRVVTGTNPVHALLYLIISLISVAMIFFATGAPFAGATEVIAYAGAIMVLFVFVVMMLNLGPASVARGTGLAQARYLGRACDPRRPAAAGAAVRAVRRPERRRHQRYHRGPESSRHQPVRPVPAGGRTGVDAAAGAAVTAFHLGRNEAKE